MAGRFRTTSLGLEEKIHTEFCHPLSVFLARAGTRSRVSKTGTPKRFTLFGVIVLCMESPSFSGLLYSMKHSGFL